jgi:hypothetical protein
MLRNAHVYGRKLASRSDEGGSLKRYPHQRWNEWRNAKKDEMPPQDHRVRVQCVVADHEGNIWVLDPAAPAQDRVVAGGPKLVKISLVPFRPSLFTPG